MMSFAKIGKVGAASALFLVPLLALTVFSAVPAFAAVEGAPKPWEIALQPPGSPSAERMDDFHQLLLWIIGGITAFVTALLLYVVIRFNARANPKPSATTHNTLLEVLWTVVPIIILIVIVIPSFKLLYYADRTPNPEMTLKVTGYQWYWGYEYPDQGGISFNAYMIPENEIDPAKEQVRLLSTDNPVVLPIETNIQILVTASDVIHSFALPSLGIKTDAVPGRINETWVRIVKPGTYFGQCSELCGKDHAFMPIEIKAFSKEDFAKWVEEKKKGL